MRCRYCDGEVSARQGVCPQCGAQVAAGLEVATKEPAGVQVITGLPEWPAPSGAATEGGLVVGEPEPAPAPALTKDETDSAPAPSPARRWSPRKERVEAWAIRKELNHYEVLDLGETATDEQVAERVALLDGVLERWSVDQMDARTQSVGTEGKNRLYELKSAFERRADYNAEVARERRRQAIARVRDELTRYAEKDMVLQWNEWQTVELKAREEGLGEDELEELLREQRERGVLTGLAVGGREVRTLLALKDRCRGQGELLAAPIWSGEMEHWLERAALKSELAAEVAEIKRQYAGARASGGALLLWRIGEKRLVLAGNNGPEEVTSVRQFIDGVQQRGLEESALAALKDRRLENWLREAMNQEPMADTAARGRDEGRKGLLDIIRQAEAQRGEAFEFENGQAYSVAELVELCDRYVEEAQGYLFDGIFSNWLAKKGHAPLARQANTIVQEYGKSKRKRLGLEMFVRELCKKAGLEPFPRLAAQPQQLALGALPVGARVSQAVRLKNEGRGHGWGKITVEPPLPGLQVAGAFDKADLTIEVALDALEVAPGDYHAHVVFRAEGVPTECRVPLSYQIVPLAVTIDPPVIDFGKIPHGKPASATLAISCAPADGRLLGGPSTDPGFKGLEVGGGIDGPTGALHVALDTTPHEPGRSYETHVQLNTNVGSFAIPVRFATALRWDIVAGWTAGVGALTGLVLWVCRLILANADRAFDNWFLSYQGATTNVLFTGGALGAVVAGTLAIIIAYQVRKHKLRKKA